VASGEEGTPLEGELARLVVPFGWLEAERMGHDGGGMRRQEVSGSREALFG
jgi:hypothetical protein